MKALILCILLCTCIVYVKAQTSNNKALKTTTNPVKGYYGIYNNATKLSGVVTDSITIQSTQPRKGYFSIGNNQTKLISARYADSNEERKKPEIKKGYYSIGNN